MKTKENSKRKFLLMLPVLVMPFLALGFYAAGGGRNSTRLDTPETRGINATLPNADFKIADPENKLGFYEKAAKDSGSVRSLENVAEKLGFNGITEDERTQELAAKLDLLNKEISSPAPQSTISKVRTSSTGSGIKNDVDRLESLMQTLQSGDDDPEMNALNGMMENILDIQHPERVRERSKLKAKLRSDALYAAIPAIIEKDHKVTHGSVVILKLTDSARINGEFIPKGQLIYGSCEITNQRLLLDIRNIRLGNKILPVDLTIFDLDAMEGINVPEALTRSAVNGGTEDAIRNIQLLGMDPSIAGQVAGAGIDAAKGLFSKKVKRIKVKLKGGYPVLIRNNKLK
ncbi:MAG: conjugative transposon protein TraM [Sphingobacteriales bacterium]|nr:MAG: conjugative transposon protein TraM [Sphingobacteriales bacterium]